MARVPLQLTRCLRANRAAVKCLLKSNQLLWNPQRTYALHFSGRHAQSSFSYLSPCLDLDNKLRDIDVLQQELRLRGLNLDIRELKKSWKFYKSVYQMTQDLEKELKDLKEMLRPLTAKKNPTQEEQDEIRRITTKINMVKESYKQTKESLWDLDDSVIQKLFKLPNGLDSRTPHQSASIIKEVGTLNAVDEKTVKSHIDIGSGLGILEYRNPMQYYLLNKGALFELGVLGYAGSVLNQEGMIRVAGSDFGRGFLVEGAGLNNEELSNAFLIANHSDTVKNPNNGMHLVGNASLMSFLSLHTKQLVNPKHFPLKYFATGRQYVPSSEDSTPMGLFTVCQTSTVQAFLVLKESDSPEHEAEFDALMETICKLYDNICNHYQVVLRPASELRPWEKLRVSFELWSPWMQQYIEVGHISICGDYFSKRLLIMYKTPTNKDYTSIIAGTVLSVPRLMGCLLEQDPTNFFIPPKIAEYMPIDR